MDQVRQASLGTIFSGLVSDDRQFVVETLYRIASFLLICVLVGCHFGVPLSKFRQLLNIFGTDSKIWQSHKSLIYV